MYSQKVFQFVEHRMERSFRSVPPRYCAAANNWAGRFAAALIASSSAKPTRLSAWSLPVVIFTGQRQALTTSFSLTRRQSSLRVIGSTEAQTEQNGLAVVIPLRNKRNCQKRKLFFDAYCIYALCLLHITGLDG